jgi:porphobilinogen synthase
MKTARPNNKDLPASQQQEVRGGYPRQRMRRLRSSGWLRELVQEHRLAAQDFVWPLFISEGNNTAEDIKTMPGVQRLSIDRAISEIKQASDLGLCAIALFPYVTIEKKTMDGREACNPDNLLCRAIAEIKAACPGIGVITDVALDPYTTHGHDGVVDGSRILNDETVEILCEQSLVQARAGADIIAPSDMMDGRVGKIRDALDAQGFTDTAIMSYAVKYASAFYGPFRDAVGSGPLLKGDKKTYQMNPANIDEAMRETALDIAEGADMVMVKPGLPYLDVIAAVKSTFRVPTIAYQVSGEYAMLKAAAQNGALNYETALAETMLCFKRAGADAIFSYGAPDMLKYLNK